MSNMSRQVRKGLALIATTATAAALSLTGVAAAHADGAPYTIRLTNYSDANSKNNSDAAAYFVSQGWYAAGLTFREAHELVGSTNTFDYHVTDSSGADAVGATVTFLFDKHWSGSNASHDLTGAVETPSCCGGADGVEHSLTGTTDSEGHVKFTLTNTNTEGQGANYNADLTAGFTGTHLYTQIAAYVANAGTDVIDITDVVYMNSPSAPPVVRSADPIYMSFGTGDDLGTAAANQAFEGGSASIVDNAPSDNGHALKFIKSGQPWAGINMILGDASMKLTEVTDPGTADEVDHSTTSFRIFSPEDPDADEPVMTPVQIELHNAAGGHLTDVQEIAPGWNTVTTKWSTIDGYDSSAAYDKFVVFPDFGSGEGIADMVPVAGQAYYIDNVAVNNGIPSDGAADGHISITLTDGKGTIVNNPGNDWWQENADSNSIVRYQEAGTDMTLTFHVTNEFGQAAKSQKIKFTVASPERKETPFKWMTEQYTFDDDGNKVLLGRQTTNARGDIILTVRSKADRSTSENRRADLTAWSGAAGNEFEIDVVPSPHGSFANPASIARDRVWTHVIAPKANAPQNVTAIRGNGLAIVDWDAPVAEDGVTVTGYKVVVSGLGASRTYTTDASDTDITIDGLTNGVKRSVVVIAQTNVLDSNASDVVNVTPSRVAAKVPGRLKLGPLFASPHTFDFDYALGKDNGATITGVEYSVDGGDTWIDASGGHITAGGLTNGVRSTILVRASNAVGDGPSVKMSGRAPFAINPIHFDALSDAKAVVDAQTLNAYAEGGTPIVFTVINWGKTTCAIEDGKVVGIKVGATCTVKAYTPGDADYSKNSAYQSFTVLAND